MRFQPTAPPLAPDTQVKNAANPPHGVLPPAGPAAARMPASRSFFSVAHPPPRPSPRRTKSSRWRRRHTPARHAHFARPSAAATPSSFTKEQRDRCLQTAPLRAVGMPHAAEVFRYISQRQSNAADARPAIDPAPRHLRCPAPYAHAAPIQRHAAVASEEPRTAPPLPYAATPNAANAAAAPYRRRPQAAEPAANRSG